jgi:hypothetical protein
MWLLGITVFIKYLYLNMDSIYIFIYDIYYTFINDNFKHIFLYDRLIFYDLMWTQSS